MIIKNIKTYHYQAHHQLTLFYFVCHDCRHSVDKRQTNENNM